MANTTWKQVVLDTADAYREANGSTEKIPVGSLADKVRAGAGTPYEGDNPLTIGQAGYNFPAKTLLKDGLQIINGVNGEDLTDTVADQKVAVEELMRMVSRKIAMNNGEGQYVWKKLTAEGGDFVDFVVSSDAEAYPNGGTQDGYWYELVEEGFDFLKILNYSKCSVSTFTFSSRTAVNNAVTHSLVGDIPYFAMIVSSVPTTANNDLYLAVGIKNIEANSGTLNTTSEFCYNSSQTQKIARSTASFGVNRNATGNIFIDSNSIYYAAGVEYYLIVAL